MNAPVRRGVTAAMTEGLSLPQPPRISIRGQRFTLVDRAGKEMLCNLVHPDVGYYLDVVIVDANPVKSKIYFGEEPWTPQSNDPPVCWSDNGIAPSVSAITPQSDTCGNCALNEIGSDTSGYSGKPIKACQDRKKLAVFVVGDPTKELYQMQITPAALKSLAAYGKWVGQQPNAANSGAADVSEVVTRLYFQSGQQGVVGFGAVSAIDAEMNARIDQAFAAGKTAEITGADDKPIAGLLAAPQKQAQIAPPPATNWSGQPAQQQQLPPPAQQFKMAQVAQPAAAAPVAQAPTPPPPPQPVWDGKAWVLPAAPAPVAPPAPPPPPQPVWDAAAGTWVLPSPTASAAYPAPPADDPYAVPGFLARPPAGAGQPSGQGGFTAAPQTQQPVGQAGAFSAPPPATAPGKGKRGGARTGAGRKPQASGEGGEDAPAPQPPGPSFSAPGQAAPFAQQQAPQNPQPTQPQFGMQSGSPPPPDLEAALARAFDTPIPGR